GDANARGMALFPGFRRLVQMSSGLRYVLASWSNRCPKSVGSAPFRFPGAAGADRRRLGMKGVAMPVRFRCGGSDPGPLYRRQRGQKVPRRGSILATT
ncbi:hypothetical protein THAOC_29114, partial [Thalassiosira oceanica]